MEDSKEKKKEKKDLKEEYNKLKVKYSLPDFEALDRDFQIEDIDPEENIIRDILEEVNSNVEFYSRLMEGLISPDSKLSDMKEASNLNKEDQTNINDIYRKCMLMNRTLLLIDLDYDEAEAAKTIIHIHKEWQEVKKNIRLILIKMKETWSEQAKKETHGEYYG